MHETRELNNTPTDKKKVKMPTVTETHHQQTEVPFQKTVTIPDSKHARQFKFSWTTKQLHTRNERQKSTIERQRQRQRRGKGWDGKVCSFHKNTAKKNRLSHEGGRNRYRHREREREILCTHTHTVSIMVDTDQEFY